MQFWLSNSSKEAVSAGEFENPGLTCGTSRTPTQRSSQAGAVSSTDISAPLPTLALPVQVPTGSCGIDRRPVSLSIWLSLSLLPLLSAEREGSQSAPAWKGCRSLSGHTPALPWTWAEARQKEPGRRVRGGWALGRKREDKGGRRRVSGREENEKRKEREANQKTVREERGGSGMGAVAKRNRPRWSVGGTDTVWVLFLFFLSILQRSVFCVSFQKCSVWLAACHRSVTT